MRNRQQPLEEREPPIQVALDVRIVDRQTDRLLVDGRGVPVCQKQEIRTNPRLEAREFPREIEPPSRVALADRDR